MNKHVIVTIHGILVNDKRECGWQTEFGHWMNSVPRHRLVAYEPFSYGWLGPVSSWLARFIDFVTDTFRLPKITRRIRVDEFKRHLLKVANMYPDSNIHVVAHSFGTWIAKEALQELDDFKLKSLSLLAGVISSNVLMSGIVSLMISGKLGTCFAWSNHGDSIVRYLALPPFGHLGYWGFVRGKHPEDRFKPLHKPLEDYNIFNNTVEDYYGHSGYFDDGNVTFSRIIGDIFWTEDSRKETT